MGAHSPLSREWVPIRDVALKSLEALARHVLNVTFHVLAEMSRRTGVIGNLRQIRDLSGLAHLFVLVKRLHSQLPGLDTVLGVVDDVVQSALHLGVPRCHGDGHDQRGEEDDENDDGKHRCGSRRVIIQMDHPFGWLTLS